MGNLRVLVGCNVVLVNIGLFCFGGYSHFLGLRGYMVLGFCLCGMETDILIACIQPDKVFHLHIQPHEVISEWFTIAEP